MRAETHRSRWLGLVVPLTLACAAHGPVEGHDNDAANVDSRPSDGTVETTRAGDAGSSNEGADEWVAPCALHAKVYCAQVKACNASEFRAAFGSLAGCEQRYAGSHCKVKMTSPGTTVTPANLVACARAESAQTCGDRGVALPKECLWMGTLANGSPCSYDLQCQSGSCPREPQTWCGSCQPRVAVGGSCMPGRRECNIGLVCADSVCTGSRRIDGACNGTTQWVCTQPVAAGGSCSTAYQCAGREGCIGGICTSAKQLGESCLERGSCSRSSDLECQRVFGLGSTCQTAMPVPLGGPCSSSNDSCQASATCKGMDGAPASTGVCSAPVEDGGQCDSLKNFCAYPALCIDQKCTMQAQAAASCR